jgi:hypothetical protein
MPRRWLIKPMLGLFIVLASVVIFAVRDPIPERSKFGYADDPPFLTSTLDTPRWIFICKDSMGVTRLLSWYEEECMSESLKSSVSHDLLQITRPPYWSRVSLPPTPMNCNVPHHNYIQQELAYGWPWRAAICSVEYRWDDSRLFWIPCDVHGGLMIRQSMWKRSLGQKSRYGHEFHWIGWAIPYKPLWFGFIGNCIAISVAIGCISYLMMLVNRLWITYIRTRRGRCACGHTMTVDLLRCPECGKRAEEA